MIDHPEDISGLARAAYAAGIDPVTFAQGYIKDLIEAHQTVIESRDEDPATFPGYSIELTNEALASRIIGELLDAGWTPPEVPE